MARDIAGKKIDVFIWRRGRGLIQWEFTYVTDTSERWFSSAGWYHWARHRVYRLTLDHDYPSKPVWLGYRLNGAWHNAEGLYEVLHASHPGYSISSQDFRGGRNRSLLRRRATGLFMEKVSRRQIETALSKAMEG